MVDNQNKVIVVEDVLVQQEMRLFNQTGSLLQDSDNSFVNLTINAGSLLPKI